MSTVLRVQRTTTHTASTAVTISTIKGSPQHFSCFSAKIEGLTASVLGLEAELESTKVRSTKDGAEVGAGVDRSGLEAEVATVNSRLEDLRTSVLELTNELTVVKAGLSAASKSLEEKDGELSSGLRDLGTRVLGAEERTAAVGAEVSDMRAGLAGLTSNIFSAKADIEKIFEVRTITIEYIQHRTAIYAKLN